jgi:lipoprotein-anchoring transpeptidase ErfK/SrfK
MRFTSPVFAFLCALAALIGFVASAEARATGRPNNLLAQVNVASQTMTVSLNGRVLHVWSVSTARHGKITPRGQFRPQALRPRHVSSIYGSAMPYSIFFRGNYAIHGTNQVRQLGQPASAGCVRLHTANARQLFALVQQTGAARTRIVIRA